MEAGYNTFVLSELGVQSTVTVPEGNYGAASFAVALTTALNAATTHAWTYSIALSNRLLKYIYSVTGNGINHPSFVFAVGSQLYEQYGFRRTSTNTFVANTLTSYAVIRMQAEDTLFMYSDLCTIGCLQEFYSTGVADGGIIPYRCNDCHANAKVFSGGKGNVYSFTLCDEFKNTISLNGQNWVMTVMLWKYADAEKPKPPPALPRTPILAEPAQSPPAAIADLFLPR